MLRRHLVVMCMLVLSAHSASAQVKVVGPTFTALSVPNLAQSVAWYRDVFGLSVVFEAAGPDSTTLVTLLAGTGMRVELVWHQQAKSLATLAGQPIQPDMVFGAPKIGFFVTNLDSTLALLRAKNATIEGTWLVRPPHIAASDTVWTRNILVRDNSGTYVQFFERWP